MSTDLVDIPSKFKLKLTFWWELAAQFDDQELKR